MIIGTVGTGGISGGRPLDPSDPFEAALNAVLGGRISESEAFAAEAWSAITNVRWFKADGYIALLSFRRAGDVIAAIRGEGDYLDWYCSGPSGVVSDEIRAALANHGWVPDPLKQIAA